MGEGRETLGWAVTWTKEERKAKRGTELGKKNENCEILSPGRVVWKTNVQGFPEAIEPILLEASSDNQLGHWNVPVGTLSVL